MRREAESKVVSETGSYLASASLNSLIAILSFDFVFRHRYEHRGAIKAHHEHTSSAVYLVSTTRPKISRCPTAKIPAHFPSVPPRLPFYSRQRSQQLVLHCQR